MIVENKKDKLYEVTCDRCSTAYLELEAEDFQDAIRQLKNEGWYVFQDDDFEWVHACPDCSMANKKKKKKPKRDKKPPNKKEKRPLRDYEIQHREGEILQLLQTYPTKILKGLARKQEAEWYFGRLFLVGVLSYDQYQAATYLDKVTRDYESMLRRYGNLHASSPIKIGSSSPEDLSQSAQKKFAKVKNRYDEVYDLLNECEKGIKQAIVDALRKDETTDIDLVDKGLTVVAAGLFSGRRKRA